MDVEKFRSLKIVKKGEGRRKIVDWKVVLENVKGKVLSKKEFEEIVKKLFKEKKKLNYSEMYRVFESWKKSGVKIESRLREEDNKVFYYIK